MDMRVIAIGTLRDFWSKPAYRDSEQPLKTWFKVVEAADWNTPADVKAMFRSADILKTGRVIFDIGGNKYRLVAAVHYDGKRVYVRFVGTHKQYDNIDPNTI